MTPTPQGLLTPDNFGVYAVAILGGIMFAIRWYSGKKWPDVPEGVTKGIMIAAGTLVGAVAAHYLAPETSAEAVTFIIGSAYGGQSMLKTGTNAIGLTKIQ